YIDGCICLNVAHYTVVERNRHCCVVQIQVCVLAQYQVAGAGPNGTLIQQDAAVTANGGIVACGYPNSTAFDVCALGYDVTGSDISEAELCEARTRAEENGVKIRLEHADFCALSNTFKEPFDIIISMDNALPHMLTSSDLEAAIRSIAGQLKTGGMFVASIRDYDAMLLDKPPYSPPYIHKNEKGQRVSFQTWHWEGDNYRLIQYIIDDEDTL
ncbi:MAG: class I SAM-dependent methyltransferase, partial [Firmicutes bacterium]|nr:class I SAM-dependent methyltransferase [Bacillota bacterium]